MVGGGFYSLGKCHKPLSSLFNSEVHIEPTSVVKVDSATNTVYCQNGLVYEYEQLVVVPGIELKFDKIEGALQALDNPKSNVASIYSVKYVQKVDEAVKRFKGGNAIFTEPPMPIKCPGATHKIVFLAEEQWKKLNLKYKVEFDI